jgi:hypothetical protein
MTKCGKSTVLQSPQIVNNLSSIIKNEYKSLPSADGEIARNKDAFWQEGCSFGFSKNSDEHPPFFATGIPRERVSFNNLVY